MYKSLNGLVAEYPVGGGGTCFADGRESAAQFSESYPLLITDSCCHTYLYNEFCRKTTHFGQVYTNFWKTHSCLWKICRERDPCLENFGPKIPPMCAAHTRTLNILCYPPPPSGWEPLQLFCQKFNSKCQRTEKY